MIARFRASVRLGAGTVLVVAGILFWMLTIALPLTSLHIGLLTSLDHVERQSLPIIVGGARDGLRLVRTVTTGAAPIVTLSRARAIFVFHSLMSIIIFL